MALEPDGDAFVTIAIEAVHGRVVDLVRLGLAPLGKETGICCAAMFFSVMISSMLPITHSFLLRPENSYGLQLPVEITRAGPERPQLLDFNHIYKVLATSILETISLTRCVVCDAPGSVLCESCASFLPFIDLVLACPRCGAPYGRMLCTECPMPGSEAALRHPEEAFPFSRARSALSFEGGARKTSAPTRMAMSCGSTGSSHRYCAPQYADAMRHIGQVHLSHADGRWGPTSQGLPPSFGVRRGLPLSLRVKRSGVEKSPLPPLGTGRSGQTRSRTYQHRPRRCDGAGSTIWSTWRRLWRSVRDCRSCMRLQVAKEPTTNVSWDAESAWRIAAGRSRLRRMRTKHEGDLGATGEDDSATLRAGRMLQRVILVDDVFTTGATLSAATQVLLDGGVREVRAVTCCRVW